MSERIEAFQGWQPVVYNPKIDADTACVSARGSHQVVMNYNETCHSSPYHWRLDMGGLARRPSAEAPVPAKNVILLQR
jgi:hypothetical protein